MNLFGTAGIRGDARERVTPELALAVGRAVAADAVGTVDASTARDGSADADANDDTDTSADAPTMVLARDGRTTGRGLADAVSAGLESGGADVRRAGHLPTPALAFASQERRGVMVTASHNPPADNGLKLFVDGEEYGDDAEERVAARVEDGDPPVAWDEWGGTERIDVLDEYCAAVVAYAREHGAPLDGLSIAVDCANGMASLATPRVLRELGATVHALNANVDGHFPGRASKPTPETIADLREFVASGGDDGGGEDGPADGCALGIAHDGDADRIVIVDAGGEVVHEDTVVAILAEQFVRASHAADPVVVTTPNASSRIDERVRAAGGRVERVRLGALHEGIARVREAGDSDTAMAFAAEPWKHVHTGLGPWIDGVASAAVLARLVADARSQDGEDTPPSGLDALRDPVTERPYRKQSVDCPDERKERAMECVSDHLPGAVADAGGSGDGESDVEVTDTATGIRVERADGSWVLVRPSGTEPKLRLYVESEVADTLLDRARRVVESAVDRE